jgi:hypothetical protein
MKIMLMAILALLSLPAPAERPVYETGDGEVRRSSGDHLDSLRGMTDRRTAEALEFSARIIESAGTPRPCEFNTPYTGRVRVHYWTHRGREMWHATREIIWPDGVQMWQGPQPAPGYYSARRMREVILPKKNRDE